MSSEQGNIGRSVRKIAVEICGRVLWGKSWGKVFQRAGLQKICPLDLEPRKVFDLSRQFEKKNFGKNFSPSHVVQG